MAALEQELSTSKNTTSSYVNNLKSYEGKKLHFDVITSIVSFLWEYTTAARDVTF